MSNGQVMTPEELRQLDPQSKDEGAEMVVRRGLMGLSHEDLIIMANAVAWEVKRRTRMIEEVENESQE